MFQFMYTHTHTHIMTNVCLGMNKCSECDTYLLAEVCFEIFIVLCLNYVNNIRNLIKCVKK